MTASATDLAPAWRGLLPWQIELASASLAGRATWPHAVLLDGPQGIGKRTLALYFARALLCEAPQAGAPCGQCSSCRYVGAGAHPDLRVVDLVEVDEHGGSKRLDEIPVKAVRSLIEWTQITSHRGVAKVAMVVPVEAMNPAAANALLKTLEEPPPATYLLLVAHQAGRVPATLRSRCRRMPVGVPDPAVALAWLAQQGVIAAVSVLAQAGGAPLRALEIASPDRQQERVTWLQALARPQALSPIALAARIEAAPKDERSARLRDAIDWLLAWTEDLSRVAAGGAPLRNVDFHRILEALAVKVAPLPMFRYHQTLLEQRTLVTHPLQPRLVVEALLIGYCALFK